MKNKVTQLSSIFPSTQFNQVNYSNQQQLQIQSNNNSTIIPIQSPRKPIIYWKDIDGLRAIAISLVLIYHAFPQAIPGGFIGVYVFFVISGFLISNIIIKQTQNNKFSFLNFYSRRVKRIYPALIVTLFFTLFVLNYFLDYENIIFSLNTLRASLIFGTNLQVLFHQKGYFDTDIRNNPLLHLWSLGVEQQFYILWPLLLTVVLKYFKKHTLTILSVYTILSFIFSIVSVYQNEKFAFYFPMCRFWQMSIGGILAYLNIKIRNTNINNVLSCVGLGILLISVWIINDDSLFPGFWALVPSLTAAFIIQADTQSICNKYILSSKLFVFIGKISYSLYLWHWPLLVASRVLFPYGSTSIFSNTYFIVFLSIGLSVLTYYTVENPIRHIKGKRIVIVLFIIMIGIGKLSYWKSQSLRGNDQLMLELFKTTQKQMIPQNQDMIQKNGRKIPNFSVNKNRMKPTQVKIKAQQLEQYYYQDHGGDILLQKRVDNSSIFSEIQIPFLHHYDVANQGKQNKLFLVGDSHMMKLTYRFQQLHRQSVQNNRSDSFPTILSVVRKAFQLAQHNYVLNFSRLLVDKYKPQRMLFVCDWLCYVCAFRDGFFNHSQKCNQQKVERYFRDFINFAKELKNKGVQVYTNGIDITYSQLDPDMMFDAYGIIQSNIKPFKYSYFRNQFKDIIDKWQNGLKEAGIQMIDLADNLCWQDQCHVVSPKGYAGFVDLNHMGKYYSRHWVYNFDHLAQF